MVSALTRSFTPTTSQRTICFQNRSWNSSLAGSDIRQYQEPPEVKAATRPWP